MDPRALQALAVLTAPLEAEGEPPFSVVEAVDILGRDDTPAVLTWNGLLRMVGRRGDLEGDAQGALEQQLAASLIRRGDVVSSDDPSGPAADLIGIVSDFYPGAPGEPPDPSLISSSQAALANLVGDQYATAFSSDTCQTGIEYDADGSWHLQVDGDSLYPGTVDQIGSSIQPLNWPRCNSAFVSVDVVDTSYSPLPDEIDAKQSVTRKFTSIVEEVVELPGTVVGGPLYPYVRVRTRLSCTQWTITSPKGAVTEAGMDYRLHTGGDGTVVLDRGRAVVTDAGGGLSRVRSSKSIQFADPTVLSWFGNPWLGELFCVLWNKRFAITVADCLERTTASATEVATKQASDHPGANAVYRDPTAKPTGPWLSAWITASAGYWDHAVSIASREFDRLEQRRSSTEPVATEDLFYDALETWEANRLSLQEGLDLSTRFAAGAPAPTGPVARPRIDDVEYPDDLARQRVDFVRDRVRSYFEVGADSARRLEAGTYTRADLVTDSFQLWGMWARDVTDATLRSIRSVNRWADDTPVPTDPRRRVSVQVEVPTKARPLSLRCTALERTETGFDGQPVRIPPSDLEISPNPLIDADGTVTVSANRTGAPGIYAGSLLVYQDDPDTFQSIPFELELDGTFERR